MPKKLLGLLLVAALAGGAYFLNQHYRIDGLDGVSISRRAPGPGGSPPLARTDRPPVGRSGETIRVASFNIQVFGTSKSKKTEVMKVLADVVRRFDVVAIQEIRSKDDSIIPRFVDLINSTGRSYDYVVGERLGRTVSKEQYAYIFDTASIEVDRGATYTARTNNRLHRDPLVSWFRVRGPPAEKAFTFKLINIHTDPDETKTELNALDDVFHAVRSDRDGEDDVILLGDLNVDDKHLGELGEVLDMTWVISGTPTNVTRRKQYDNIVFSRRATSEYARRGGVLDLMAVYSLTQDQAKQVSDHLPIWAEFSIYEDGAAARVAFGRSRALQ